MIESKYILTGRLKVHYLEKPGNGNTLILIHGNGSSSNFYREIMGLIDDHYRIIAPDMRGYGETEDKLIDATRGFDDFADDIKSFLEALKIEDAHFAGHSLGGGMLFAFAGKYSDCVKSLTLINPSSPFGFGGTKGEKGLPCNDDFSGSGAGVVNPEFVKRLKEKDRSSADDNASPRSVMNAFYWKPPFVPNQIEELLDGLLSQKLGNEKYPGDFIQCDKYPFVAPGIYGPMNAGSPKYLQEMADRFISSKHKFPVLWVRGAEDQIVSNNSMFDLGTLGKMGVIEEYPGEKTFPPQPMVDQTRYVLTQFQKDGGSYTEVVMKDTGHSPFIEKPNTFLSHFENFINNNKMKRLENKVAIITGAADGIGKAGAEKFASEGAQVIIWDVNDEKGNATAKSIEEKGGKALYMSVNTANFDAVETAANKVIEEFGKVDILVNNAGITRDASLKKMTSEQWQQVIDVNLTGVFNCTKVIGIHMTGNKYGRIINTSSVVALYGNFGQTNYVATKAGVIGMTKTWARELGSKGVTVNAVAPGFILTDMVRKMPENVLDMMKGKVPLGHLGETEDIANAYLFLASDEARYVNGTTLSVDGGMTI